MFAVATFRSSQRARLSRRSERPDDSRSMIRRCRIQQRCRARSSRQPRPTTPHSRHFESPSDAIRGSAFPEAELRQQFVANPDGSVGRSLMSPEIRRAITVDAQGEARLFGHTRARAGDLPGGSARSRKWPLTIDHPQRAGACRTYASSMRQRAPCTRDGNRIFSLPSPRLESSNCQARISSCFCRMRLTCFGRYEHSRPH